MKFLSLSLSSALLLLITGCKTTPKTDEAALGTPVSPSAARAGAPSGPITTASGLQYQILASGPAGGRSPTLNDSVTVHYRGTLTDGTVFDSSYDRGEPTTFPVGGVIPGWTEALQLMKPGDKWMLFIPSHLAYGPRAMGDKIPANSDLNFQVELLQIANTR